MKMARDNNHLKNEILECSIQYSENRTEKPFGATFYIIYHMNETKLLCICFRYLITMIHLFFVFDQ